MMTKSKEDRKTVLSQRARALAIPNLCLVELKGFCSGVALLASGKFLSREALRY